MKEEYTDFTKYPEGLLTKAQEGEMVKVNGIARACDIVLSDSKKYVVGMLELGKGKFVDIYGSSVGEFWNPYKVLRYLKTSSESNQEIQVKGVYSKGDCKLEVQSLKLGNLEEIFFDIELKSMRAGQGLWWLRL